MRVRNQWTTRFRLFINFSVGTVVFSFFCPEFIQWYKYYIHEMRWRDHTLQQWKDQEKYRWKMYLKIWDPYNTSNLLEHNMGTLSNTRADKMVFGKYKMEEAMPYDKAANEVISYAETTGIDPAKPMLETIKKMVKYYYPFDLDDNPDETKRIIKPKVQWVYGSNFDEYVDREENLPPSNSLARLCWNIPGMQDMFFEEARIYEEEEEELLRNSTPEERIEYYQNLEWTLNRIGMEVDTYAPLLAYRPDRKQKFVNYMKANRDLANTLLSRPGGLKQIFINANIISPRDAHDMEQTRNYRYTTAST